MDSNTSRPIPRANTGSVLRNFVANTSTKLVQLERRFDPWVRPAFDALLRDLVARGITALINGQRSNEGLALAEERPLHDEEQFLDSIITSFQRQMSGLDRLLVRRDQVGLHERADVVARLVVVDVEVEGQERSRVLSRRQYDSRPLANPDGRV